MRLSINRCGYLLIDAAIYKIDFLKLNLLSNGLIEKFWDALWLGIGPFLRFICNPTQPQPDPRFLLKLTFLKRKWRLNPLNKKYELLRFFFYWGVSVCVIRGQDYAKSDKIDIESKTVFVEDTSWANEHKLNLGLR